MRRKILSSLFLLALGISGYGQRCALGVMADSEMQKRHEAFQRVIDNYQINGNPNLKVQEEIVKIPVVVHVIHNQINGRIGGNNNSNISDQQIFSQIRVLNEDFRREAGTLGFNSHPDGADMEMEFFLASIDPDGNPSSGITRNYFNESSFDVFSDLELISNISYWDSDKYLNVWVVDLKGSYLGYSEFPGASLDGLKLRDAPAETDGIFMDYEVFGSQIGTSTSGIYSYGRTLTHEVGHWFGLLHTWGDVSCGDDYCADTPQIQSQNDSERCRDVFSRCNGVNVRNMIENYMDYTPDSCMNIFTSDQKARVRIVLELSQRRRRMVLNSQLLLPNTDAVAVKILNNPSSQNLLAFQILLPDFQDFSLQFLDIFGREVAYKEFKDYPSTVVQGSDLNLPSGVLILRMRSGLVEIVKRVVVL